MTMTMTTSSNNSSYLEDIYCSEIIFMPKRGITRLWWVKWNNDTAWYSCHSNFEQIGGDAIRHCNHTSGEWSGEEIICRPVYMKTNLALFLQIFLSTLFVSVVILIVDFILRRYRKGQLRNEKLRIARITRIRNMNQIEYTRIRNFPKFSDDIVGEAIREITREADKEGGQVDDDVRYQKGGNMRWRQRMPDDVDDEKMNIFQAFRPKIKV